MTILALAVFTALALAGPEWDRTEIAPALRPAAGGQP